MEKQLQNWSRGGLCVDDRMAADLLERGRIDSQVRQAVAYGVPASFGEMGFERGAMAWPFNHDHLGLQDLETLGKMPIVF